MAQLINITSEALQATIRRLLPSQQGFGEDLQASNVITPVINITPTAEGSQLPVDLARSFAFGSNTTFSVTNTTTTLINTPGFYRLVGIFNLNETAGSNSAAEIKLSNGLSNKNIQQVIIQPASTDLYAAVPFDFAVFLDSGESVIANSNGSTTTISGSFRQVADRYGNISNPSGFTFE
jgi:hypothetical protein